MPEAKADNRAQSAYAQVVLDIPTRALDCAYDYLVPTGMSAEIGCCVLVDFANRPALGYITGVSEQPDGAIDPSKIKPLKELLSTPYFDATSAQLALWIAEEYMAPLSEVLHLFTPPGSSPRIKKDANGNWQLIHPGVGPIDDRWIALTTSGRVYEPPQNAVKQRAIIEALRIGEMRVAELSLEIAAPAESLKALNRRGVISIESRRRVRGQCSQQPTSSDISALTTGQRTAVAAIRDALERRGEVIVLDGVTGSGKTEVYLQAIRSVLDDGGSACVLVPEISLTPQTVARFRARFGDLVAILHSRLSPGERFDQWDQIRCGTARVVVGARSALFAPLHDLRLIVIDEEHESTYKQNNAPRYLTRDVAEKLAQLRGAALVLGSATPSMETLHRCEIGTWKLVALPQRASGKSLPPVLIVNLAAEFKAKNTSMFSRVLSDALSQTVERGEKAVLLLNKRGFASFLLCRDCGYVPTCDQCSTSYTYHIKPSYLMCHHCGVSQAVPSTCPQCGSPYLRQLGPGTQYAEDQLRALLPPGTPIIRMDADSTRGKNGHERQLDEFMAASTGVLLGTQMIAKGLDFPEVTLVGVLIADTSLKFPDFRAPERTYQLLEQVAGRAGRAEKDGRVIVQTYWPEHVAIRAAAEHNREMLLAEERKIRSELGYPPYSRLANILIWGKDKKAVITQSMALAQPIETALARLNMTQTTLEAAEAKASIGWKLLGPSPCVFDKRQGSYRWHMLVKAPAQANVSSVLSPIIRSRRPEKGVNVTVDIDPYDLM
ncbi:MAG: primosomal protein N' [Coriobacteriaceae bacterium]|nr:primosomal protein N' [Coriobacteriaceae bacterium]